jgi:hypothetical protein
MVKCLELNFDILGHSHQLSIYLSIQNATGLLSIAVELIELDLDMENHYRFSFTYKIDLYFGVQLSRVV